MKEILKVFLTIIAIAVVFFSILIAIFLFCLISPEEEKSTDISDYSKYFGKGIEYRNQIFPESIPNSAKVEDFCYYYYNRIDPSYVSYLVYTCDDEDFVEEYKRLMQLDLPVEHLTYGATGFYYPVSAIYTSDSGYNYALADEEKNRLIYVQIDFCDCFCSIDYEKIIDEKHLPIKFNAKHGNPTQKRLHETCL